VADVKVSIGFRWKTGMDAAVIFIVSDILLDDLVDKVDRYLRFPGNCICGFFGHNSTLVGKPSGNSLF
jgi:hypothetical protein